MSRDEPVPRRARDSCRRALESAGLRKRAGDVYTFDSLVDGTLGRVALNTASNGPGGRFEINPVMGVCHEGIESRRSALVGTKGRPYELATLSSAVGYLMPEGAYRAWFFEDGSDFDGVASDLAAAVVAYGFQFGQDHAELEVIADDLEQVRFTTLEARKTRLPIAYELLGRPRDARRTLDASLAEVEGETHMAAEQFRTFVERFDAEFAGPG